MMAMRSFGVIVFGDMVDIEFMSTIHVPSVSVFTRDYRRTIC
jgi:hypothetical protein